MKDGMKVFGWGAVAIATAVTLSLGGWAWKYYTAPIKGKAEAERAIESSASRIARYEYFYDLCVSVQAGKASLSAQRERLGYSEDKKESSRIRANVAALQSNIARTVSQYNAESGKNYTSARFKASNLPYQLKIKGETTCVTQ